MKKDQIPKPILERVENELLAKEELLWVGLPKRNHIPGDSTMASKFIAVGLLAMMIAGLVVFMVANGSFANSFVWSPLVLIVAIGIVAATIPIIRGLMTGHQLYAITNRRAIIMQKNKVQSFSKNDIQFIERNMHRNGTGDIVFREEHYQRVIPAGMVISQRRERLTTGFYGIDNPTEVEALMLETFREEAQDYSHLEAGMSEDIVHESQQTMQKPH